MRHPFIVRVEAAQSTIDQFLGKPFEWGRTDCAQLAAHCLKAQGYADPLQTVGEYWDYRSAKKAMKRASIASFAEHFEQALGLERIAPAEALPGDIVAFEGFNPETFGVALGVAIGQGRIVGFANDICDYAPDSVCVAAWRALPQGGAA
jgi:hypothetical protein